MSMTVLTLWQLTGIFCAYLFVTVGLPAFVFGKKLRGHRAPERFMLYFMTGNFFVMNLVFALQLLKISYPVTLILGTFLIVIIARVKINHIPVKENFLNYVESLRRLSGGQMGTKTAVYKIGAKLWRAMLRFCRWAGFYLFRRFLDCILIALLLVVLWYIYGNNLVEYYGYKASDVLVHNYWINSLGNNDIFVAGVYPYGFHCVIYYLHAVFGIETYVLLRLFAFVANVMVHLMLLCVLRLCCRSRYAAYVGAFAYVMGAYFRVDTFLRFCSSLPQEFGIIFIMPAIYFGFAFFETRRQEVKDGIKDKKKVKIRDRIENKKDKKVKKERFSRSSIHLAGFCMSFSMTLAVHFYGTMIAGLFCVAMACGYCFLLFRKKFLWKVVSTVTLSVLIAVLPMALAFIGGTPMEGSLIWAMNIIQSEDKEAEQGQGNNAVVDSSVQNSASGDYAAGDIAPEDFTSGEQGSSAVEEEMPVSEPKVQINIAERISQIRSEIKRISEIVENTLNTYVFSLPYDNGAHWVIMSFLVLIGLGCFYILVRRSCYGAMLVSTGLYMLFLCLMMVSSLLGIPSLMDRSRGSIYFAYSCPMALAFLLDSVLYIPFFLLKGKAWQVGRVLLNGLSLACVAGVLFYIVDTDQMKAPRHIPGQEMNESVICLTNIIKTEDDFNWTIVSANDEMRMGWDHGYHYETITFLREMEKAPANTMIRIPTRVVYFFVEKIPIDYNIPYIDSGQSISEEGASYMLPGGDGIHVYQARNRWILMSRMYYWAETFQQLCPNEMDIYMETESFICYRVEQDPYRLYNFALDYGYNDWDYIAEYAAD